MIHNKIGVTWNNRLNHGNFITAHHIKNVKNIWKEPCPASLAAQGGSFDSRYLLLLLYPHLCLPCASRECPAAVRRGGAGGAGSRVLQTGARPAPAMDSQPYIVVTPSAGKIWGWGRKQLPPTPTLGKVLWRFTPCGLKFQDESSRTINGGGWALLRSHISHCRSQETSLTKHAQKGSLEVKRWVKPRDVLPRSLSVDST